MPLAIPSARVFSDMGFRGMEVIYHFYKWYILPYKPTNLVQKYPYLESPKLTMLLTQLPSGAPFFPPDRKGLLDFMLESASAMLLHHASHPDPARAARQWIPPSIPPDRQGILRGLLGRMASAGYSAGSHHKLCLGSQLQRLRLSQVLTSPARRGSEKCPWPWLASCSGGRRATLAGYSATGRDPLASCSGGILGGIHWRAALAGYWAESTGEQLWRDTRRDPLASCQSSSPAWFCLMSRPAHSWVYISCWCLCVLSVP